MTEESGWPQGRIMATVVQSRYREKEVPLVGTRGAGGAVVPHVYSLGGGEQARAAEIWQVRNKRVQATLSGGSVNVEVTFTMLALVDTEGPAGRRLRLWVQTEAAVFTVPLAAFDPPPGEMEEVAARLSDWRLRVVPENGNLAATLTADLRVIGGKTEEIWVRQPRGKRCRPAAEEEKVPLPALAANDFGLPAAEGDLEPELLQAVAAALRAALAEAAASPHKEAEPRVVRGKGPANTVETEEERDMTEYRVFIRDNTIKKLEDELESYRQETMILQEQNERYRKALEQKTEEMENLAGVVRELEEARQAGAAAVRRLEEALEQEKKTPLLVRIRRLVGSR